ncbi:MAG: Stringent starvation protein B [Methylobacteriaceae bacterium]|nr:Stringent starvation protein B [Methylobacteriaceae bacterium]
MATDLIRYDLLVQEALRGVVKRVLEDTVREGLRGEHHYYVTFRTNAPGVRLSERMRERYPDEMTIILQHQFWGLSVTDQAFEVGLSFSGVRERLLIPFEALTGFFDPSVQFGLKFEAQEAGSEVGANDAGEPPPAPARLAPLPAAKPGAKPVTGREPGATKESKPAPRGAASEPAEMRPASPARDTTKITRANPGADQAKAHPAAASAKPAEGDPKVISIDAFRKKP